MRVTGLRFGKLFALVAAAALFAGCGDDNEPPDAGTIRLENESDIDIYYVYFRDCDVTDWGSDRLGATEIVDIGETRDFSVAGGCYDLKAEDSDHAVIDERSDVDIDGDTFTWTVD